LHGFIKLILPRNLGDNMSYLDKTFCASPKCRNDCGRRMTDKERDQLIYAQAEYVNYGYFCGEHALTDFEMSQVQDPSNKI
jgi:hypothetical protein